MKDFTKGKPAVPAQQDRSARLLRVASLLLLLLAIGLGVRQVLFQQDSATATGKVVQLIPQEQSQSTGNGGTRTTTRYRPEISFSTPDGTIVHFVSIVGSDSPQLQVGQSVGVRYQPDNPGRAQIERFEDQWLAPGLCAALAIVLAVIRLVLRRRRTALR